VTIALTLDGDRVADLAFTGQGCSISQSSASMLTALLRGRTLAEADAIVALVRAMLHGDAAAAADPRLGDLRALAGVARFPARVKCAALPWEALVRARASIGR
jgi:nitrogen fixation NifU-like protein